MSTETLRHWALRTAKDSSRAAVSASTRRVVQSSGSTLASSLPSMRQGGKTPLQIRELTISLVEFSL